MSERIKFEYNIIEFPQGFKKNNIELKFIKSQPITYTQFENTFVPWLSIVDVMMFNSKDIIKEYLNSYTLL